MRRRITKTISIISFRMLLGVCVAVAVGLTNNFLINFSNSPDLKLLVSGNLDDIKAIHGKYRVTLTLENRGSTVSSSRVKLKVPRSEDEAVTVNNLEKEVAVGNAMVLEPGFVKESENDKTASYKRDIEFKVFPNRNYDVGTLDLDFSKIREIRVDYSVVAESMVKRVGYYVFHLVDGKVGIKEFNQEKDTSSMNATGWGKFFRYLSGKNIR